MGFLDIDTWRKHKGAFAVAAAANIGSILFGYDTGIAGGVVNLQSFQRDFGIIAKPIIDQATGAVITPSNAADISGNIIALLNAGGFFGAIIPSITTKYIGRRHTLIIAGLFFLIGGVIQTAAQNLGMIYAGRIVAGFGLGMISQTSIIFVAECSPKHLRGILMSAFELFLVTGGMLAYWTTYGCSVNLAPTKAQWQVPLSLQVVLAVMVMVSALMCQESPRWLAKQGKWEDSAKALASLRGAKPDDNEILEEMAEIKAQIDEEIAATKGRSFKEMAQPKNLQRLFWGLGLVFWFIWGGHNAILYYAPVIFNQIAQTGQNAGLLASGVFTCLKFASTIIFIAGAVHYFRRKTLLIVGGFFMGVFLFVMGAVLATHPPTKTDGGFDSPQAKAMMAMLYLFVIAYSLSWGPTPWIYLGEMFPTRIRDYSVTCCGMLVWALNLTVSKIAPIMIANIGFKTWMVFGTANILGCIYSVFLPETGDRTLEEMDILFGNIDEETRRKDIEARLAEETHVNRTSESQNGEKVVVDEGAS